MKKNTTRKGLEVLKSLAKHRVPPIWRCPGGSPRRLEKPGGQTLKSQMSDHHADGLSGPQSVLEVLP